MGRVPPNSTLTYQGRWKRGFLDDPAKVLDRVGSRLADDDLPVRDVHVSTSIFEAASGVFNVTFLLQVENGVGYADEDDVISIIRHEVFETTGEFPLSDTIPKIKRPGGQEQKTDQPEVEAPPGDKGKDKCGFFDKLSGKGGCGFELTTVVTLAVLMVVLFMGLVFATQFL